MARSIIYFHGTKKARSLYGMEHHQQQDHDGRERRSVLNFERRTTEYGTAQLEEKETAVTRLLESHFHSVPWMQDRQIHLPTNRRLG